MRRLLPLLLVLLLGPGPARAAGADRAADGWTLHPGAVLPREAVLRDATGAALPLGRLFRGIPVILDLGYFHCPGLCGLVRHDLMQALAESGLRGGRDYLLAVVSIDPRETPADAAAAARQDAAVAGSDGAGWHYLTGPAETTASLRHLVGFPARYESAWDDFVHPAGLVVLTGGGRVSSYLTGLGYQAGDLRAALAGARPGGLVHQALPVLLLCFHYDQTTGRYTLAIMKLLRLMGGLTILTLAGLFLLLQRQRGGRGR